MTEHQEARGESYDDDVADTIRRLLRECDVDFRDRLDPAVGIAGRQLEFLKPAVAMAGPAGFLGSVAAVQRGAILIVLADAAKVVTIHLLPLRGGITGWIELIDSVVIGIEQRLGRRMTVNDIAMGMSMVVTDHGGPPGGKCAEPGEQILLGIVGWLLAHHRPPQRHQLFRELDKVARQGVCPAMVGLIGPVASGDVDKCCCAWPLILPLAPYFEIVTAVSADVARV